MSPKKITILGSSHVYALMLGICTEVINSYEIKLLQDFTGQHNVLKEGEPPQLRDDVAAWIDTSFDGDLLLLTISGSDWLEFCASNRVPKIDIVLPDAPELGELPDAQIIPLAEMRRLIAHRIRHVVGGIKAVRNHVPSHIPIWYIAPPPPNADNDFIRKTLPFAQTEIERFGVTDALLRRKMYLLHSAIIAASCAANGVRLIPPPKEGTTEDGYLATDCVGNDCLHANSVYGRYVIRDIERYVSEL